MHRHVQEDFVRSKEFQQVVQGKIITLEELVHMRRVLTAASLENLPQDSSSIKDDVTNGKVSTIQHGYFILKMKQRQRLIK